MWYQMVMWLMTSRDPKGAVRQYSRLSWFTKYLIAADCDYLRQIVTYHRC